MPILTAQLQDPPDPVLQGEQLHQSVFDEVPVNDTVLLAGALMPSSGLFNLVRDEDAFSPMNSFIDGNRLSMRRLKSGQLQMRSNAGIVSPCGAWIFLDYTPLLNRFEQASVQFRLNGITKDSTGAALGNCRVVVFETGRIALNGSPVVGETISDGSGNYTQDVPMNTAYQAIAYKPGSPDVAGITRNDLVPVST